MDFAALGIGLLVGIGILAFILFRINSKYKTLLSNEQLADMSAKLGALKLEANNNVLESTDSHETMPASVVTSIGMPLTYSVSKDGSQFSHQLAVSFGGTYVAHSAAMTVASWIAYCLSIPCEKITVPAQAGDGSGRVRHIVFSLSAHEQENYLQTPVRQMSATEIKNLWKAVMNAREAIMANSLPPQP